MMPSKLGDVSFRCASIQKKAFGISDYGTGVHIHQPAIASPSKPTEEARQDLAREARRQGQTIERTGGLKRYNIVQTA